MRVPRILLVEDDIIIGASLSRALGGTGYEVEWARDATSARAAAARVPPDLVLLDLGLPDGDGIDVCAQLVAQSPGVPVIGLEFDGPYGVYHSMYDDFYWMNQFGDPGYRYHTLMSVIWGRLALRLARGDSYVS